MIWIFPITALATVVSLFAGSFAFPDNGDERSQVDAFFRRLETKTE